MRITIEIDEKTLAETRKATGVQGKSPAVARAVDLFLRQERRKRLIGRALAGETNYAASNEALEGAATYDAD